MFRFIKRRVIKDQTLGNAPSYHTKCLCPRCKYRITWEYQNYCSECGQKLSWRVHIKNKLKKYEVI